MNADIFRRKQTQFLAMMLLLMTVQACHCNSTGNNHEKTTKAATKTKQSPLKSLELSLNRAPLNREPLNSVSEAQIISGFLKNNSSQSIRFQISHKDPENEPFKNSARNKLQSRFDAKFARILHRNLLVDWTVLLATDNDSTINEPQIIRQSEENLKQPHFVKIAPGQTVKIFTFQSKAKHSTNSIESKHCTIQAKIGFQTPQGQYLQIQSQKVQLPMK